MTPRRKESPAGPATPVSCARKDSARRTSSIPCAPRDAEIIGPGGPVLEVRLAPTGEKDTMRFDQLTIKSQEAVQEAQRDARARGNAELTPDHLLLALLKQTEGVVVPILQKLGVNPERLAA